MSINRGDIFYVQPAYATGSEQASGRPAIVVSNDKCNQNSSVIEIVYLTTKPKADLPTHVTIRSANRESTALCEQITSVSVDRLGDYIGHITKEEASNLEIAMLISLDMTIGIKEKVVIKEVKVPDSTCPKPEKMAACPPQSGPPLVNEFVKLQAQYDLLKRMYDELLDRNMKAS